MEKIDCCFNNIYQPTTNERTKKQHGLKCFFIPSEEKLNVLGARYAVCVQMDIIMIDFQIEYSDRALLRIGQN